MSGQVATGAMAGLALSEEQEEFRRTIRAFLDQRSPEAEVRRLMETEKGYDEDVLRQMNEQLGLGGLVIPEEYGGAGFGFAELVVVLEEMGRRLLCAPYLSTAVAAQALLHCGDEEAKKLWLPRIAAGETIATLALAEDSGRWDEAGVTAVARPGADGWTVTGAKSFVLDGHVADLILVAARTGTGVSLLAVRGDAPGLVRTPLRTLDPTRKQARAELTDTPAVLVGAEGQAGAALERVVDLAAVALAAEQVGGARFLLEETVRYAKDRHQFGRPIGGFQAIKHKCADMLLGVESAATAVHYAGRCAATLDDELPTVAALVKAHCSETFFRTAAEAIQVHGAIGFSWEHPAHLYYKRAKSGELLFGDPAHWRELLARRLGL
ncbi:acyl-CoA dehydrogenase family protein [Streptosporangium sp. NPDC002607]